MMKMTLLFLLGLLLATPNVALQRDIESRQPGQALTEMLDRSSAETNRYLHLRSTRKLLLETVCGWWQNDDGTSYYGCQDVLTDKERMIGKLDKQDSY